MVVIGARRRHQGLGAHLCRFLAEEGAEVVGIVGTSDATAHDALAALGIDARAGADAEALIRDVAPDALVVASPSESHDAYLQLGLAHGLHVLCEKPLCWSGADAAERARTYAEAYRDRGLHLVVNTQWPYTLDAYRELFPGALDGAPRCFWMRLSPDASGESMLPDALPHALSLLLAVLPHPTPVVEDVRLEGATPDSTRVVVSFTYCAGDDRVAATVDLERQAEQPRLAAYGYDDRIATRSIRLRDYRLWLEGEGRTVDLPDPTPRLVRSFLARVSSSASAVVDPNAWPGMALLQTIHAAWPR